MRSPLPSFAHPGTLPLLYHLFPQLLSTALMDARPLNAVVSSASAPYSPGSPTGEFQFFCDLDFALTRETNDFFP